MLKEESGVLMLFGNDWEAIVTAEYDEGDFTVVRIELRGYYAGDRLIEFSAPAIVDLDSVSRDELENMAGWFDIDEPDDDFDIDGKRWVL